MSEKNSPLLAAGIALAVVLAAIGGYVAYRWLSEDGDPDDGENPTIDRRITFPKDEGSHDEPFEVWYVQADLKTYDNQRFSLSVAFCHEDAVDQKEAALVPLSPAGARDYVFVPDGSLSCPEGELDLAFGYDDVTDRFYSTGEFEYRLEVTMNGANFTLDLEDEKKAPVLPYDEGKRTDYTIGSSFEYFQSRVAVFGSCNVSGYTGFVHGDAWIHHSWDYMNRYPEEMHCVQLKGGTDVWIYQMWSPSRQPYKSCVITVAEDGNYTQYEDAVLSTSYGRYSYDEAILPDIVAFPTAWSLEAEEVGLDFTITGSAEDQFMQNRWGGLSSASGTLGASSVSGIAFSTTSLSLYANPSVTSVYSTYLDQDLLPLQNFTVKATVQDSLPIDKVYLRYNISRTSPADPGYTEIEMTLADDGFYYGAFRNPLYNWVVTFKVIVVDVVGAWGESERYDESISWDTP